MTPQTMLYNAMALAHAKKVGGEMLNDFSAMLSANGETKTVDQLLNMTGVEFMKTNANEVMATTAVGFGKEFVETVILAPELIERLKLTGNLLSKAQVKTMTGANVDFPVRGAKTRMVIGGENSTLPSGGGIATQTKRISTKLISLVSAKLTLTSYYSDELLEDSVIDIASYVLSEIIEGFDNSVHEILINGDTTTGATGNINIVDANTSTLPDGNKTDFLLFNGGRKIALLGGKTVDCGANLAVANVRTGRALMGVKGRNPKDLALVPDSKTYFNLMNLSQVETIEKFGDSATIKEGRLVALDGIEIVDREEMGLAKATGEISGTGGLNVKGQMLLVHTPSILVGIRKGLTTEMSRYAEEGETGITGTARIAVGFDNTQNSKEATTPAVLLINI